MRKDTKAALAAWQADLDAFRLRDHPNAKTVREIMAETGRKESDVTRHIVPALLAKGWRKVKVKRQCNTRTQLVGAYDPPA